MFTMISKLRSGKNCTHFSVCFSYKVEKEGLTHTGKMYISSSKHKEENEWGRVKLKKWTERVSDPCSEVEESLSVRVPLNPTEILSHSLSAQTLWILHYLFKPAQVHAFPQCIQVSFDQYKSLYHECNFHSMSHSRPYHPVALLPRQSYVVLINICRNKITIHDKLEYI